MQGLGTIEDGRFGERYALETNPPVDGFANHRARPHRNGSIRGRGGH